MKVRTLDSSRRVGLHETAVRLGSELGGAENDRRQLLDTAVALAEGEDPEQLVNNLNQSFPRVVKALRAVVSRDDAERGRAAARFLLAVTMGMRAAA